VNTSWLTADRKRDLELMLSALTSEAPEVEAIEGGSWRALFRKEVAALRMAWFFQPAPIRLEYNQRFNRFAVTLPVSCGFVPQNGIVIPTVESWDNPTWGRTA
jgi:hypothetical protein